MKNMLRMLLLFSLIAIFAISYMGCNKYSNKVVFLGNMGKGTLTFSVQLGDKIVGTDVYNARGQFQYKSDRQYSGKITQCEFNEGNRTGCLVGITGNGLWFTASVYEAAGNPDRRIDVYVEDGYSNCRGIITIGGI